MLYVGQADAAGCALHNPLSSLAAWSDQVATHLDSNGYLCWVIIALDSIPQDLQHLCICHCTHWQDIKQQSQLFTEVTPFNSIIGYFSTLKCKSEEQLIIAETSNFK